MLEVERKMNERDGESEREIVIKIKLLIIIFFVNINTGPLEYFTPCSSFGSSIIILIQN